MSLSGRSKSISYPSANIMPGKQFDDPRRSYAYVKGQLHIYEGKPELVITSADQIWDGPPK